MVRVIVRRLLGGILLLVLLSFTAFFVANEIPQNKACMFFLDCGKTTAAQRKAALHAHGFDQSVFIQYGRYLWHIIRDRSLGTSWNGIQLDTAIAAALPPTASLVLGGMLLMLALAIPLGAVAALRPRSVADRAVLTSSVAGLAVHPFVLGVGIAALFRLLGAPRRDYCPLTTRAIPQAPSFGGEPIIISGPGFHAPLPCGGIGDWAKHLVAPWFVFALMFVPLYVRMVRTRLLGTLSERYVTTARAKGATEGRVVIHHALRNAMGPLLPMIALDAGTAITAAIYVETVFGLPGLGHLAVIGLSGAYFPPGSPHYDLPLIVGLVLTIGVFVVALNMLADIASAWLDPRLREAQLSKSA
jgi:peptide/nickel transport system permease protein